MLLQKSARCAGVAFRLALMAGVSVAGSISAAAAAQGAVGISTAHPARFGGFFAEARFAIGAPAPSLTLTTLDGRRVSTDELRGSVVILAFWATWCEPCRTELPILSAYAKRHAAEGLRVIGISLDEPDAIEAVRKVAATLDFPVAVLGSAYAGGYGRIWKLPASFTIDRQGRLADDIWSADEPTWTERRLDRVIGPLLGGQI